DRKMYQRQQPARDHRADDADDDVADQSEAAAFDDLTRKPAGDRTDDQPNDDIHQHERFSPFVSKFSQATTSQCVEMLTRRGRAVSRDRRRGCGDQAVAGDTDDLRASSSTRRAISSATMRLAARPTCVVATM